VILVSMGLVLVALAALLLGVLGAGDEPLRFVYASIGTSLLAAVLLVAGVLRSRPARVSPLAGSARGPSWSGAVRARDAVAGPPAREAAPGLADDDPEAVRFTRTLEGLALDTARIERLRGRFVTLEALAAASTEELAEVPGISPDLAQAIGQHVGSVPPRERP
jgi:hypothetical protein